RASVQDRPCSNPGWRMQPKSKLGVGWSVFSWVFSWLNASSNLVVVQAERKSGMSDAGDLDFKGALVVLDRQPVSDPELLLADDQNLVAADTERSRRSDLLCEKGEQLWTTRRPR